LSDGPNSQEPDDDATAVSPVDSHEDVTAPVNLATNEET